MSASADALRPLAPSRLAVFAALAIVYLVWGSTYLAIRVAVLDLPPLLVTGTRFVTAGAVLYAASRWRGIPAPAPRAWAAAAALGAVTFVVSHGTLTWASQFVPSGTAALMASASPAWIALGGAAGLVAGHRPTARGVLGIVVGLAGVAVVLDPAAILSGNGLHGPAVVALLVSSLAWATGSVMARWSALPDSPTLTSGMAMLAGGAVLLAASFATGEPARLDAAAVAPAAWLALAYLIVVGSVLAYSAYVWLLRVDGPARVSAHAFVNPVVAVLLGAALAGEPLTAGTGVAVALVAAGVALMSGTPRRAPVTIGRGASASEAATAPARARVGASCSGCPA